MIEYTHVRFNNKEIALNKFKSFIVTGTDIHNKRFKPIQYSNFFWANGINLYNGSVWGIKKSDNKRQLLKRVYN